jgi:hypothetical protein
MYNCFLQIIDPFRAIQDGLPPVALQFEISQIGHKIYLGFANLNDFKIQN